MSDAPKPSKLFIEIDADCEYLRIGEAEVRLVRRRRRGNRKTRYEITAPRTVPIEKLKAVAKTSPPA